MESELLKWAFTQGALAVVLLMVISWWRHDFKRFQAKDEEKISVLIEIISHNTASNAKLTELIENQIGTCRYAPPKSAINGRESAS